MKTLTWIFVFYILSHFRLFGGGSVEAATSGFHGRAAGRPDHVVMGVDAPSGKRTDLWAAGVRRKTRFRLTNDATFKSALQCAPCGRRLVYVSEGKVFSIPIAQMGGRKRVDLGTLPEGLWKSHEGMIEHFIKLDPFGKYVAFPDEEGVRLAELDSGKSRIIKVRSCGPDDEGADGGKDGDLLRPVHPVFWMNNRQAFLYPAIRGKGGRGGIQLGVYDVVQNKQVHCLNLDIMTGEILKQGIESVDRLEAVWNHDGSAVVVSLRLRLRERKGKQHTQSSEGDRIRVFHRVVSFSPERQVVPPKTISPVRWNGWQYRSGALLFTGRSAKQLGFYAWNNPLEKGGGKTVNVESLSANDRLLSYNPFLQTALVETSGLKGCRRTRLMSIRQGRRRPLIRWGIWSEAVAVDPSGQWGVFRSAARCEHKRPVLYLMRVDGSMLSRELPERFKELRALPPSRVALCPRIE